MGKSVILFHVLVHSSHVKKSKEFWYSKLCKREIGYCPKPREETNSRVCSDNRMRVSHIRENIRPAKTGE